MGATVGSPSGSNSVKRFNPTAQSGAYTANSWDFILATAAATITMPANPSTGDMVYIQRGNTNGQITILPNTGQNINSFGGAGMITNNAVAWSGGGCLVYVPTATGGNQWIAFAGMGTDMGLGDAPGDQIWLADGFWVHTQNVNKTTAYTITQHDMNLRFTGGTASTFTFGNGLQAGQMGVIFNESAVTLTLACAGTGSFLIPTGTTYSQLTQTAVWFLVVTAGANPQISLKV